MYRRLRDIISRTGSPLSGLRAQSLFGLPGMATDYDSQRQARYTMVVSGQGGWKLRMWVQESAFPLDATLVPAFQPDEDEGEDEGTAHHQHQFYAVTEPRA